MKKQIILEIKNSVPSKKNRYKIKKGGRGLYKDKRVKAFEESFAWQVKGQIRHKSWLPLRGYIRLMARFIIAGRDKDLDNIITSILDCLENCRIIENDKQITEIEAIKEKGKQDMCYIILEELK